MKNLVLLFSLISLSFIPSALSYENQEDVISYEDIVKELSPTSRSRVRNFGTDPLSQVRFHVGVGFANSLMDLQNLDSVNINDISLKGVQAKLGIDLLSPSWRAEGGIITYETYQDVSGNKYSVKEFDLSLISISPLARHWSYKFGGGLSARYLDYTNTSLETQKFSTPAMNIQTGVIAEFSPKFSVSTDLVYRKSMTSDSADRSAIDFSLRFDGHF